MSPNGANSDIGGRKGMNGGSSSAFGITAAGGSPGDSFYAGKAGGVASNITSGPGFGGRGHVNETVSEQGEDGSLIMTFGIRAPGGGGGGGTVTPPKPALEKGDHYAYIIGYQDGTIRANGKITRAEVATIFFRLLTDESRDEFWSETNEYSDVSGDQWFNNAISTLANAGILTGIS